MEQTNKDPEAEINALTNEYNLSAEKLGNLEFGLTNINDKCYQLLKDLYKKRKFYQSADDPETIEIENQYNKFEADLLNTKLEHRELLIVCFRQIQKLRQLQYNYLLSVINNLQGEHKQLQQQFNKLQEQQRVEKLQTEKLQTEKLQAEYQNSKAIVEECTDEDEEDIQTNTEGDVKQTNTEGEVKQTNVEEDVKHTSAEEQESEEEEPPKKQKVIKASKKRVFKNPANKENRENNLAN